MVRSQLVKALARGHPHLTLGDVRCLVDVMFGCLQGALVRGERVELRGIGSFWTRTREPGQRRNPRSGAVVAVGRRRGVAFRPSRVLLSGGDV